MRTFSVAHTVTFDQKRQVKIELRRNFEEKHSFKDKNTSADGRRH